MIGHLIEVRPWFLEQSEKYELKRLGDLLTFQVEEDQPLHVQYLYPQSLPPQPFPLSGKFVIRDGEALSLDSNHSICFDAESSRVLNIRPIR